MDTLDHYEVQRIAEEAARNAAGPVSRELDRLTYEHGDRLSTLERGTDALGERVSTLVGELHAAFERLAALEAAADDA